MELMQRTLYKILIEVQIKIPEIVVSFATSNQRENLPTCISSHYLLMMSP